MKRGAEILERPGDITGIPDTRSMGQLMGVYAESARYVSSPTGLRNFRSYRTMIERGEQAIVALAQAIATGGSPLLAVPFEDLQRASGQEPVSQTAPTLEQKAAAIGDWAEANSHVAIRNPKLRIQTGQDLYSWLYSNALANMTASDRDQIRHPHLFTSPFGIVRESYIPSLALPTGQKISVKIAKTEIGSRILRLREIKTITIAELSDKPKSPRINVELSRDLTNALSIDDASFRVKGTTDSSFAARDAILEQGKRLFGIK